VITVSQAVSHIVTQTSGLRSYLHRV
jgi:hypothetical protein